MSEKRSVISIGEGLTIVANLGLVIGLMFVWLELRQNQTQLAAEVELNIASTYQTALGRIVDNSVLAETIGIAYFDPESLTPAQFLQFTSYHAEWMVLVFATYQVWRSGAIDDEVWDQHSTYYMLFLRTPWLQEFWRDMNHNIYPKQFLRELEARLPEPQTFSIPE